MVLLIVLVTVQLPERIMIASSMTTYEMKKSYGASEEEENYKKGLQNNLIYREEKQEHYHIFKAVINI